MKVKSLSILIDYFFSFFIYAHKPYALCKFLGTYKNLNQRVSHTTPIYIIYVKLSIIFATVFITIRKNDE